MVNTGWCGITLAMSTVNTESVIPRVLDDETVYELDLTLDRGTFALMQDLERIARDGNDEWLLPGRPSS
jgi:hypothetical protein